MSPFSNSKAIPFSLSGMRLLSQLRYPQQQIIRKLSEFFKIEIHVNN